MTIDLMPANFVPFRGYFHKKKAMAACQDAFYLQVLTNI